MFGNKMKGEIMKNLMIFSLTVFILSCATPPQILDDRFISSQPNFQVQFHKPIVKKSVESQRIEGGDIKTYHFSVNNTESILIQIFTVLHSTRIDYFYGPERVLTNISKLGAGQRALIERYYSLIERGEQPARFKQLCS